MNVLFFIFEFFYFSKIMIPFEYVLSCLVILVMSFIILYCTLDMLLKLYNVLFIFCKASKSFTLLDSGAIKVLIIIIIMLIIIIIKFIYK